MKCDYNVTFFASLRSFCMTKVALVFLEFGSGACDARPKLGDDIPMCRTVDFSPSRTF